MYDGHVLCVFDTSCHFLRAEFDLITTTPTVLIFYSQSGRLTDSVWGKVWAQGRGDHVPHATD
jgi:hypothetical protein